jgi:hypothetical protein
MDWSLRLRKRAVWLVVSESLRQAVEGEGERAGRDGCVVDEDVV